MPDQTPANRSLSEISHLFLSSVREKQTNGAPRPKRIPPGQARLPQDGDPLPLRPNATPVTPSAASRETAAFSQKIAGLNKLAAPATARRTPALSAVLAAHLGANQVDRVKEYARHLAATIDGRVGLIEVDGAELRILSFEVAEGPADDTANENETPEIGTLQDAAETLEELNYDVDRWLLLVTNPRTPEARALLHEVDRWVLLSTCDHDGVVASYRLLKGLAEPTGPRLSLALLDGADSEETGRVYRKLAGVCQQFLNWELHEEPAVGNNNRTLEHLVLCCRPTRDKGQIAAAPQWGIVGNFLKSVKSAVVTPASAPSLHKQEELDPMENTYEDLSQTQDAASEMPAAAIPFPRPQGPRLASPAAPRATGPALVRDTAMEVIDLPADAGPESILTAILQQNQGELVECPVRAPMCDGARLAITRDRRLVLLAVTRAGLSDLRAIGQAYRWISENRSLIAMAVPQFAIDLRSLPGLRLLVDHADMAADVLQPILHAEHVTVQAYRKVRWGSRTGLFLEAA